MDKKDIYEHLAKIYLDASSPKKPALKKQSLFKRFGFIALMVLSGFTLAFFTRALVNRPLMRSSVALILQPEATKINFHFDPAKKESFSLNLNKLNLSRYKSLSFSVKKTEYSDTINLKVEFTNIYKEKSEVYLVDISNRWKEFSFNFSQFKNIHDWSEMDSIAFIVEEWNARGKNGAVYIDNVCLLR